MSGFSDQLQSLKAQLHQNSEKIADLWSGLTDAQRPHKPSPERWSVAECIAHLTLSSERFLPQIDTLLARAQSENLRNSGPFTMDVNGRLLTWILEPPYRYRTKTQPEFNPGSVNPLSHILPAFQESQDNFVDAMNRSNGYALDKLMFVSPFNAKFKYNLYSLYNVTAAHQRRHIWQAEQVIRKMPSVQ